MNLKKDKDPLRSLIALLYLVTATASAQDIGNLLKGFVQANQGDLVGAIKSVAEVSFGHLSGGAQSPHDAEGKVVLYKTSWCGYCKRAAAYMQQKNIPFVERDIETNSAYKAEYARLGGKGQVPYLVFGRKTLQGFGEREIDQNYAEFQRVQAVARPVATNPSAPQAEGARQPLSGGMSLRSGDTLIGKIPGIRIYTEASKSAQKMLVLSKAEEVIYMGEERDGFYRVTTTQGDGWVDKLQVKKP
jgi:glutaredoxin